jgi:AcrR family transcriptional regulator
VQTTDESLVRIPEICEATDVNYGSVYDHFDPREGVIDAAYECIFARYIEEDLVTIAGMSPAAPGRDEFVQAAVAYASEVHQGEARRDQRLMRVRIVAAAAARPHLRELIGPTQAAYTAQFAAIIATRQERGFVRRDLSPRSIAVLLQSAILGRTLDDISSAPIKEDEWRQTAVAVFAALLS